MTEQKAAIYLRYSCDKQREESIEGQRRVITDFAEKNGYRIVAEYVDRATSAKTDQRPNFLRMVEESAAREFQFIIVYALDRFSRNRYDSAFYKHKLKKNGVRVISATERIGDSPDGIITEAIIEAIAEYYSAELGVKTRRGMYENASKGMTTGSVPPLGYKWGEDKKLHIDESTAEIPRIVFSMYADGANKMKIARALNEKGYRTRTGRPFKTNSFDVMLTNRKYIGVYTYQNIEIDGGCPALIDRETFNRVQTMVERTKKAPARGKAKVEYYLAGKLFCGKCGEPLLAVGGTSRNGTQHHYYRCKGKINHTCDKKPEVKDFAEWLVTDHICALLGTESRQEMLADKLIAAYSRGMSVDKVSKLTAQLDGINRKINHIVDEICEGRSSSALRDKLDSLELQKSEIEDELSAARIAAGHIPTQAEIIDWFSRLKLMDAASEETRKHIIGIFVQRVFLWDDKVVIALNLPNTEETVCFDEIRQFEEMSEETQKPLSDNTESGSYNGNIGSPSPDLYEHITIIAGIPCLFMRRVS